MFYLSKVKNNMGGYYPPQSIEFPNSILLTDEQASFLCSNYGFVNIIEDDGKIKLVRNDKLYNEYASMFDHGVDEIIDSKTEKES